MEIEAQYLLTKKEFFSLSQEEQDQMIEDAYNGYYEGPMYKEEEEE